MDFLEIFESAAADDGHAEVARRVADLSQADVEALIRQALDPRVPVQVLFAALDRYVALAGGGDLGPT